MQNTSTITVQEIFHHLKESSLNNLLPESICIMADTTITTNSSSSSTSTNVADWDLTKNWKYSDLELLVDGEEKDDEKRIHVNKAILSMWSPVFDAMFSKDFKEKNATVLKLPGKSYEDILQLCRVLHPPCSEITGENILQLLPLLQEYQIDNLLEKCQQNLLSEMPSIKNYLLSEKYSFDKLKESCLSYMKRCPATRLVKEVDYFNQLEKQFVFDLLLEKCEKYERNVDNLRDLRMVIERKKPSTFPGMEILCGDCITARESQVDCESCLKNCCRKLADILKVIDR